MKRTEKAKDAIEIRKFYSGHLFLTLSRSQASNRGEERSIGKTSYLQMVFLRYLTLCYPKRRGMFKNK